MITETGSSGNESAFLYRFLVSPQLRWVRYLTLFLVLGVISFNQVFIIFIDSRDVLKGWIYVLTLLYLFTYIVVLYLNLFWLFPKYLLSKRYLTYLLLLSASMIVALLIQAVVEYVAYSHWLLLRARETYFSVSMVMDYISSFLLSTLCMIGGTMTFLLKAWMIDYQRVSQMEKAHVISEMERLKEQVSPQLLFKILHHSGQLAQKEPERASKMLMKLSQLLRYQLYDCSRAKVLLSGEITFLTNYLALEQNSRLQFNYMFASEGEVNRSLVPPLLFIPFVQHVVKLADERQPPFHVSLRIHLKVEEDVVLFTCDCPGMNFLEGGELGRIRQRLDLLYGNRYNLVQSKDSIRLELKGGEE